MDRSVKHLLIISSLFTILGTVGAIGITFYGLYIHPQELALKKAAIASGDGTAVVARLAELMDLPGNEVPTIAVIRGVEEVKNQPALAMAQPGDVVLVYPTSNLGIVYDPKREKVRNVGPIIPPQPPPQASGVVAGAEVEKPAGLPVVVIDAVKVVTVRQAVDTVLMSFSPKLSMLEELDPSRTDYAQSLVMDVTGTNTDVVQNLAKSLSGRVVPISEELKARALDAEPTTQIVVVIGQNAATLVPTPTQVP